VKAAFVAITFAGFVTLWLAVLADMGTSLVVTANGLRLLRGVRRHAAPAVHEHDEGMPASQIPVADFTSHGHEATAQSHGEDATAGECSCGDRHD